MVVTWYVEYLIRGLSNHLMAQASHIEVNKHNQPLFTTRIFVGDVVTRWMFLT